MTTQDGVEEIPYWQFFNADGVRAESDSHSSLRRYLGNELEWRYRRENWYFSSNMNHIQFGFTDVTPDVALHIGLVLSPQERNTLASWRLGEPNRPAPTVVFEICSDGTWPNDVTPAEKPLRYQQIGVKEYFVYDPSTPRLWKESNRRLRGWRYDGRQGLEFVAAQEILPDERGWLFSEQLDCYLVPDGQLLQLRDRQGNILPDADEAAQQAEQAARQANETARQADKIARQAEQAAQAALSREAELRAKLRARGINPDDL